MWNIFLPGKSKQAVQAAVNFFYMEKGALSAITNR
jgi:hypothetical protein